MFLEYPVGEMELPTETLYKGQFPRNTTQGEVRSRGKYRTEFDTEFEIVGSVDTRNKISNTTSAPFRYICQILKVMSDGNTYVGTGFFIGPKTILTAGHNIWDKFSNSKVPLSKISVAPGRNGSSTPFGKLTPANTVASHSGFSKSDYNTSRDYAIIHLATDIGNTTGYFGRGVWEKDAVGSSIFKNPSLPAPPPTLSLNLSGYPGDKGGDLQYSSYNMGSAILDSGKILTYLNDTKGGHSGSPVWVKRDSSMGGRVVVGIHIARGPWATSPSGTVQYNRAVFINNEVRAFITANLK